MLAATEPGVRTLTVEACTQLLKTTLIENVIGRNAHVDPCPILVVYPKDDLAETFSKDRLDPMIRDTPVLREVFGEAKARSASDTIAHKQYLGGSVTMVGANSPGNLAMRPIKIVLFDEIDLYPLSAGGKGAPIPMAEERLAEFAPNTLSIRVCSPTIDGRSSINKSYLASDQRRAFVACPHCSSMQELLWERVRWEKDAKGRVRLDTVRYYCAECDAPWTEADRLRSLQKIEWRQTREFFCCGEMQKPEKWEIVNHVGRAVCRDCGSLAVSNEHAGFNASKLYAPKQSLRDLVKKFQAARDDGEEEVKTFFNTQLARTWKERGEAPEWKEVFDRRSRDFTLRTVPAGALVLFGGVDVQKDRLEVRVWGFGRGRQRWLIDIRVLAGSPLLPAVWKQLEELFDETWRHSCGAQMSVRDWGIDAGSFASEVAAFVRFQRGRGNVHAVRGTDREDTAFVGVGKMDVRIDGKTKSRGLRTYRIGVSFCKKELMGQLELERPSGDAPYPPGFVHLPSDLPEDEAKQLTSEELQTAGRGRKKRAWELLAGRRNEGLDCANYARGLAAMRGWDRWREVKFAELEAELIDSVEHKDKPKAPPSGEEPPPRSPWVGRQQGWLNKRD